MIMMFRVVMRMVHCSHFHSDRDPRSFTDLSLRNPVLFQIKQKPTMFELFAGSPRSLVEHLPQRSNLLRQRIPSHEWQRVILCGEEIVQGMHFALSQE